MGYVTTISRMKNPKNFYKKATWNKQWIAKLAKNTQNNRLSVSPIDAKDEIAKIMSDANHPYHKGDETAVEKVRQLHEKAYGN